MAIATYAELQTAIRDWLADESTTVLSDARIEDMIAFTEDDLNTMAKHPLYPSKKGFRLIEMQKVQAAVLNVNDPYISLPPDYLEMRYVTESSQPSYPPLKYLPPSGFVAEQARVNEGGRLSFYTISGGQLRVGPEVCEGVTLEMGFYAKIPALSDTNTSNWLLTKSPRTYVYGALRQCAPFLDGENASSYDAMYLESVVKLIDANEVAETSSTSIGIQPSAPVA